MLTVPPIAWIGFGIFFLVMLALDLGVFHRRSHTVTFRESAEPNAVDAKVTVKDSNPVIYFASLSAGFLAPLSSSEHGDDLKILSVSFREPHGNAAIEFPFGTDIQVEVRYQARVPLPRPYFWVAITCRGGALMEANMLLDGVRPECIEGEGVLSCTFLGLTILPGTYTVLLGARRQDGVSLLVRSGEVGYFIVVGTATDVGYRSEVADSFLSTASPFFAPYEWRFPDGRVERVGLSCARRSSRE